MRQVKALSFRSFVATLQRLKMFDAVRERVSPTTRALFDDLPPSTAWIDGRVYDDMSVAIHAKFGREALIHVTRESIFTGVWVVLRPVLQTMQRLFGTSPHSLFQRMQTASDSQARGITYHYRQVTERHGIMTVMYEPGEPPPEAALLTLIGAFESMFALCNVTTGMVKDPVMRTVREGVEVTYDISW